MTWRRRGDHLLEPKAARKLLDGAEIILMHVYAGQVHEHTGWNRTALVGALVSYWAGAADPNGDLVGAVLERIPAGKGFEEQAGWLFLLGLAAGEGERELQSAVGDALADIGWRVAGGAPLHPHAVSHGIAETRDAIESMAGGGRHPDRDLMVRLAQAALFGIRSPE